MLDENARPAPDALLLIAHGCPHCPTVLAGVSELVKLGLIGRLEVVNVTARPEVAEQHGIRGVPWLRLGPFELDGLRTAAELKRWAERAGTRAGMAEYFRELLAAGELIRVIALIQRDPSQLNVLLLLLADPDTELAVRVGIGAVFEEFAGKPALKALSGELGELTRHAQAHVRGDAAHYLGLTRDAGAAVFLEPLANDPEKQVRDIARESLTLLNGR